ncbi:hypothetical protein DL770_007216 [Monosporascus sp. CRB-9-2]|nr:hypothetical protein DL770_007216 [Monosporascus sp. CRB-9-2]
MTRASTISSTTSTTSDSKTKPRPGQLSIPPISAAASPASAASPPHSDVSTPTSTSTTSTPQIAIKPAGATIQSTAMAAVTLASAGPPKCSITSKEWVIPPRPKPGRKPATDTPPTKRKAQNRAAQRAFRERRAARVGELEEQLEEQREEHERAQQELRSQVHSLDAEVQNLRARCVSLESTLEKERSERSRIENELESFKRRWRDEASSVFSRNNSLPALPSRAPSSQSLMSQHQAPRSSTASNASEHRNSTAFSISQIISPPDTSSSSVSAPQQASADPSGCGSCSSAGPCACVDDVIANTSVGCGKCSVGTKCECLEAILKGPGQSNSELDLKRRHSSISPHAPDEKRQKSEAYAHEIDFTAMFSKKTTPQTAAPTPDDFQPVVQRVTIPPRDSCGFCQEGTYCMCAEAAAAASSQPQTLAPIGNQVQTPPPSENDVGPAIEVTSTGAVKLPGIRSLNRTPVPSAARKAGGGCGPDGPGTCAQCLADPKSGLFCRSLAATAARASGLSSSSGRPDGSGCCGGGGGKGGLGCCKSQGSSSASASASTSSSGLGVSLSCADAYKTLSSHRNFERAADEIGTWLPKLRAIPQELNTSARAPIEVETASIMSVLKGFDVRFGKNA